MVCIWPKAGALLPPTPRPESRESMFPIAGKTHNLVFVRCFPYRPKKLVREFPFLQSSARVGSTMHCLGLHAECISKETRKLPKISFDQTIAEVAERLFKSRPPGIEMSDLS